MRPRSLAPTFLLSTVLLSLVSPLPAGVHAAPRSSAPTDPTADPTTSSVGALSPVARAIETLVGIDPSSEPRPGACAHPTPPPTCSTSPSLASASTSVVSWENITGAVGAAPSPRVGAAITYDASDGYVLLFGGENGAGTQLYSDTWKFVGGVWTNITATAGLAPSPRVSAGMVFDAADGYVVLYGGLSVTPGSYLQDHSDTWTFYGGTWVNISSTAGSAPAGRFSPAMAFDWDAHEVVLFGGESANDGLLTAGITMYSDTWTFAKGTWTQVTSSVGSPPSARAGSNMVFDPTDAYLLLYGGVWNTLSGTTITGYVTADTWKFQGGHWTNLTASVSGAPGNRALSGIAFDPGAGVVVMFGGCTAYVNQACPLQNSTWTYASSTWTDVSSTVSVAPSARGTMAMTNDTADGYLLFYGGSCGSGCAQADTWREPAAPSALPSVTFLSDPSTCGPVTVDGLTAVSGASVPLPKGHLPLSVGACQGRSFLGWNASGSVGVQPAGSASTTLAVSGTGSVTAWFSDPLGVGDVANSSVVGLGSSVQLTAGAWGGEPPYAYQWSENGTNLTGSEGTADPTSVPFSHAAQYTFDVWAADASGRVAQGSSITVKVLGYSPPPLTANLTLSTYFAPTGTLLRASATTAGGTIQTYTWTENGTQSLSCPTQNCTLALPHGGTYGIEVQVLDSLGRSASSSSAVNVWNAYSEPPPGPLSITMVENGTSIMIGSSVELNATPVGGVAPYRFVLWTSLTGNSSPIDGRAYAFDPPVRGAYSLRMWVIDSAGEIAGSNTLSLQVTAPPACLGSSCGPSPAGLPPWLLLGIGAGVIVAAVVGVALVLRRRKRYSRPSAGAPDGPQASPAAPTSAYPVAPAQGPPPAPRAPPQPYSDERAPDPLGGSYPR